MASDAFDGSATQRQHGYRMLWGALGPDARAALVASARSPEVPVPRSLAVTITEATQSLEIDGRLMPHVLGEAPRGSDDPEHRLDPAFAGWVLDHAQT